MDEAQARAILGNRITATGELADMLADVQWPTALLGADSDDYVFLEGVFTSDELEAIAWWIKNSRALAANEKTA